MTPDQADPAAPRNVFLFSGHMIDAPGREHPRFPADKEPIAGEAIARTLAEEGAGPGDLAICGGACGGDLIFAEAALAQGLALELYIPFEVPTFLTESIDFAGANWRQRFLTARSHAALHIMSEELGPLPAGQNAYESDNLWMLAAATRFGAERLAFICLWNGEGGDGPGGTRHLLEQARAMTGRVYWLDTRKLWR